jgi:hypothetical protein
VWAVDSGTGLTAAFTSVCVAENGDAYAVGYDITTTASPGPVLRVSSEGDTIWSQWLDGIPECATLDSEGNLCIVGRVSLGKDIGTWKVSPAGDVLWGQTYDGPSGLADCPYGITSDVYGNTLVCGYSVESTVPEYDVMVTLAYSPSGSMLWVENYLMNGHMLAYARGVGTDSEGCVYVTGNSRPQPDHYSTCVTIKYPATPGGVEEGSGMKAEGRRMNQTVVRGTLPLQDRQEAELLDISGRKVMDRQPGENDISRLSPGVYFVRRPTTEDGRPCSAVRKIIIQR